MGTQIFVCFLHFVETTSFTCCYDKNLFIFTEIVNGWDQTLQGIPLLPHNNSGLAKSIGDILHGMNCILQRRFCSIPWLVSVCLPLLQRRLLQLHFILRLLSSWPKTRMTACSACYQKSGNYLTLRLLFVYQERWRSESCIYPKSSPLLSFKNSGYDL